ncbi:MAG: hypothetical protein ACKVHR_15335 [Pirellulales bacterium]
MRREARCGLRITLALLGALVGVFGMGHVACLAQLQPSQYDQTPPNQKTVEPSPLSQFSFSGPLVEQMSHMQTLSNSSGTLTGTPAAHATSHPSSLFLVTREVDLKKTLQKYAKFKGCSLDEAFATTVSTLKMSPILDSSTKRVVGAEAAYSIVGDDVYRITASQLFFDALSMNLMFIENGKRRLTIETHFLKLPMDKPEEFKPFLVPGSFVAFSNRIPQAKAFATSATYRNEMESRQQAGVPAGTFVMSTETKTKVYPTFMGRLTDEGVNRMVKDFISKPDCEIVKGPRVVVMPGIVSAISVAESRPFVVGVNRVEGKFSVAHQPIVQVVEQGNLFKFRLFGDEGKIRLNADLALSDIASVETLSYSDPKRNGPLAGSEEAASSVTVQVPEHKLKQVHFSTLVEDGLTVFIDPVFTRKESVKPAPRTEGSEGLEPLKPRETEYRMMMMIKPRWTKAE